MSEADDYADRLFDQMFTATYAPKKAGVLRDAATRIRRETAAKKAARHAKKYGMGMQKIAALHTDVSYKKLAEMNTQEFGVVGDDDTITIHIDCDSITGQTNHDDMENDMSEIDTVTLFQMDKGIDLVLVEFASGSSRSYLYKVPQGMSVMQGDLVTVPHYDTDFHDDFPKLTFGRIVRKATLVDLKAGITYLWVVGVVDVLSAKKLVDHDDHVRNGLAIGKAVREARETVKDADKIDWLMPQNETAVIEDQTVSAEHSNEETLSLDEMFDDGLDKAYAASLTDPLTNT